MKSKKIVIHENFATGEVPSYFSGGFSEITPLPENNYSHTSAITGGTSTEKSNFSIQPSKYDKITLEIKDVKLSNDANVIFRFGLNEISGVPIPFNALFNFSNRTLSTISFIDGVNHGGTIHENFNFRNPHDFKIVINIKEKYVDYIVEGSLYRITGINNLGELEVEFSRISTSDGTEKTAYYKDFKLVLE